MNSPMELIAFSQKYFVISPGLLHDLIRRENKLLANEAFMSNTIVFLKKIAYGLKITNYINHMF